MIDWGCGQRGKGDHSRFLATELGMRLGDWISRAVREVWACLQPTCCPGIYDPLVRRGCLLDWGPGYSDQWLGQNLGEDGQWDPQEMWAGGDKGASGFLLQH